MLRTEGRGFESRLWQGLAGSRWEWQNWLVTPRERGGLSNLDSCITKRLGHLELRQTGERMRLGEGVSLYGSLDPTGAARDEVYAVDLIAWGVIGDMWVWLATKLGEKGIKSEINWKKKWSKEFISPFRNVDGTHAWTRIKSTITANEVFSSKNILATAEN